MSERYGKLALLLWAAALFSGAVAFGTIYVADGTPSAPGLAFSSAHGTGMSRVNDGIALGTNSQPAILVGEPSSAVPVKIRNSMNFCDDTTTACVGDASDDVLSISYAAVGGAYVAVYAPLAAVGVGLLNIAANPIQLVYNTSSSMTLDGTGSATAWTDPNGINIDVTGSGVNLIGALFQVDNAATPTNSFAVYPGVSTMHIDNYTNVGTCTLDGNGTNPSCAVTLPAKVGAATTSWKCTCNIVGTTSLATGQVCFPATPPSSAGGTMTFYGSVASSTRVVDFHCF